MRALVLWKAGASTPAPGRWVHTSWIIEGTEGLVRGAIYETVSRLIAIGLAERHRPGSAFVRLTERGIVARSGLRRRFC